MAAICSRIPTRNGREKSSAGHLAKSGPRVSLKRSSSSALPDMSSDSKRANSMIEAEAVEVREECFQGLAQSLLKMLKGIVASSDVEFFRNGVSDAQRVSSLCFILSLCFARILFSLTCPFALLRFLHVRPEARRFFTTSFNTWDSPRRSLLK